MFELAWKIIEPNGNQPIKMKSFSTEEKRQDFIDTMSQRPGFVVVSINDADSHTVSDFTPAMRFTALPVVSFAAVVLFMIVKEILFLFREEM